MSQIQNSFQIINPLQHQQQQANNYLHQSIINSYNNIIQNQSQLHKQSQLNKLNNNTLPEIQTDLLNSFNPQKFNQNHATNNNLQSQKKFYQHNQQIRHNNINSNKINNYDQYQQKITFNTHNVNTSINNINRSQVVSSIPVRSLSQNKLKVNFSYNNNILQNQFQNPFINNIQNNKQTITHPTSHFTGMNIISRNNNYNTFNRPYSLQNNRPYSNLSQLSKQKKQYIQSIPLSNPLVKFQQNKSGSQLLKTHKLGKKNKTIKFVNSDNIQTQKSSQKATNIKNRNMIQNQQQISIIQSARKNMSTISLQRSEYIFMSDNKQSQKIIIQPQSYILSQNNISKRLNKKQIAGSYIPMNVLSNVITNEKKGIGSHNSIILPIQEEDDNSMVNTKNRNGSNKKQQQSNSNNKYNEQTKKGNKKIDNKVYLSDNNIGSSKMLKKLQSMKQLQNKEILSNRELYNQVQEDNKFTQINKLSKISLQDKQQQFKEHQFYQNQREEIILSVQQFPNKKLYLKNQKLTNVKYQQIKYHKNNNNNKISNNKDNTKSNQKDQLIDQNKQQYNKINHLQSTIQHLQQKLLIKQEQNNILKQKLQNNKLQTNLQQQYKKLQIISKLNQIQIKKLKNQIKIYKIKQKQFNNKQLFYVNKQKQYQYEINQLREQINKEKLFVKERQYISNKYNSNSYKYSKQSNIRLFKVQSNTDLQQFNNYLSPITKNKYNHHYEY